MHEMGPAACICDRACIERSVQTNGTIGHMDVLLTEFTITSCSFSFDPVVKADA